ncbi:MAG: NADH-quinone oxidoreductase subunit N [Chloroflexi bacterium]|uniref:NADH-quinone oxidoreductase subunit N n=1 Tax=Candidatus Chlorohelix allophototropha TaxID=3003348 RepID=A0A8T7LZU0_9CHLR|nr:NADH-quinone oxidoreductase subunit N [Chloroflexota bacterium]WJW67716.1 NADH-quinone oxidoreductase subunit N [Chloroflexota bacterium L227-S17]
MGLSAINALYQVKIDKAELDKLGQIEWGALWPAWIVSGGILLILLADLILPKSQKNALAILSFITLVAAVASAFTLMDNKASAFQGMVAADDLSRYMAALIFGAGALVILASPDYFSRIGVEARSEYYALMLAAITGMWLLAVSLNLMVFFVALELFSLPLYVLAGFLPRSLRGHEAGFKYFLLSSFATAFMLYGMALLFGVSGTTQFNGIAAYFTKNGVSGDYGILALVGLGMLSVGFAFKVSAVPFHMWTPDVYEGSPTPVTALMAVGTKAAIIAAFLRVYTGMLEPIKLQWQPIIFVLAIVTMIVGNMMALSQQSVKRLLAYSAIAQAGYLLVGIASDNSLGREGVLFYLFSYTLMTLGAFTVILALEGPRGEGQDISYFTGLARNHPGLAAVMTVCLLSLGGIPPTAGFFGKALVFGSAVQAGGWYLALALVGVATSVIAVFYYFRIVVQMYMAGDSTRKVVEGRPGWALVFVLMVTSIGTLTLGILAGPAFEWAKQAVAFLR